MPRDPNQNRLRLALASLGFPSWGVRINVYNGAFGTLVISLPVVHESDWKPMLGLLADLQLTKPQYQWHIEPTQQIMFDLITL
jgi:hypothetical protein